MRARTVTRTQRLLVRLWPSVLVIVLCGCVAVRDKDAAAPPSAPAASSAAAEDSPLPPGEGPGERVRPQRGRQELQPPATPPVLPLDSGARVFAALREQLHTRTCSDDALVRTWMHRYAQHPAGFAASLRQILPLLGYVLERVREAGLPGEFALLPIVESWYRLDARHRSTAGIWQFSPATARGNGLRVDGSVDERYAVDAATDAAMRHLQALVQRFGDWRLAVMAFNAGEYRIAGVLRRASATSSPAAPSAAAGSPAAPSPEQQLPAGLSRITYEHLAKLLALACLVHDPDRVGLQLPDIAFVPLQRDTLPVVAAAPVREPSAGWYVVRSGDSLWAIARRHGIALVELLRWNGLRADTVLQPGRRLRLQP